MGEGDRFLHDLFDVKHLIWRVRPDVGMATSATHKTSNAPLKKY